MPSTQITDLSVTPISAFADNYIWLLQFGTQAIVVDPGDAQVVLRELERRELELIAIVLTHHHNDHIGGVKGLIQAYPHDPIAVYGPAKEEIEGVTNPLRDGDSIFIEPWNLRLKVFEIAGHTRGHLAYYSALRNLLFCGDTLFGCGCGRLFEGSAEQMKASLDRLRDLPEQTKVYCAHEYTLSNIRFARAVEPNNIALQQRARDDQAMRDRGEPTLPSTISLERSTNPFLRCEAPAVRESAIQFDAHAVQSATATFAALRKWKDGFK